MKTRTLLAATAAVAVLAVESPAETKTSKKPKAASKPAATETAEPKKAEKDEAPAAPKKEESTFKLTDPVAVVDGQEIKIDEMNKVIENILSQRGGKIEEVPDVLKPQLYRNVIDGVIAEKLVTRASEKVEVTDKDVSEEFDKFKAQFPDPKAFDEQLKAQGQSADKIKGEIRRYLQQNRWMDEQVKGKVDVTDAEVETFYKDNPDQFKQPEQVRASHILVKVEKDAKEELVKEKRAAADKILERVKKGEDFDKLATEVSEDPSAKQNHGDLEFFEREQMVPEFSAAAFKMKKGDLSTEPVRSDYGFHIIKLTDRKESGSVPLAEAKPQLQAFLQQRKRQAEIGKVLRTLREGAKVKINLPEAPATPGAPGAPGAAPASVPASAPEPVAPETK